MTDLLGFAYSALVCGGGLMGYVKAHSIPSLAAGLTFGALLAGGAYMNSQATPKPLLQLTTAAILGTMMGFRYYNSGKIMPAGIMAGASILMLVRGLVVYNKYLPVLGGKID